MKNVKEKVCVFIGGGGSTEISIYDGKIKESANTQIGAIDIMNKFPDLSNDIPNSSLEEVKKYIKRKIKVTKRKSRYFNSCRRRP